MNKELWNKCVEFHGHECPGLAIGFRACEIAKNLMKLNFSQDEEILCITENDACGVDAVQVITGCTIGKGNLIYHDTGKMAFSFINRNTNENIRLILKPINEEMTREERKNYILNNPYEEVFKITECKFEIPEKARRLKTIICDKCGEGTAENKIHLQNGQKLCNDCFNRYTRGW